MKKPSDYMDGESPTTTIEVGPKPSGDTDLRLVLVQASVWKRWEALASRRGISVGQLLEEAVQRAERGE